MSDNKPTYEAIEAYRRRQRYGPFIIGMFALILVAVGILLIWMWYSGSSVGELSFFTTETPTATITPTPVPPTATQTATLASTVTETIEPSTTPLPNELAPIPYIIQSGDTFVGLAELFGLDPTIGFLIIMDYNNWNPEDFLQVGQTIIIPNVDAQLFTPTPLPPNLFFGTEILYRVLPGDSLGSIAEEFLSTVDAIVEANDLDDANFVGVGDVLIIPVRLVTAVPTITPTFGPSPTP